MSVGPSVCLSPKPPNSLKSIISPYHYLYHYLHPHPHHHTQHHTQLFINKHSCHHSHHLLNSHHSHYHCPEQHHHLLIEWLLSFSACSLVTTGDMQYLFQQDGPSSGVKLDLKWVLEKTLPPSRPSELLTQAPLAPFVPWHPSTFQTLAPLAPFQP